MIPVIDIFAGPGGLGEGFSAFRDSKGHPAFRVCLSIEKDYWAWQTLRLRAFFREFPADEAPTAYYQCLKGEITLEALYKQYPEEAENANAVAQHEELGSDAMPCKHLNRLIKNALRGEKNFVLIGGPPCQAYSIAGRSRNKGIRSYKPENDHRTTLYIQYLQILADHRPPAFIMENVKGLLSTTLAKQHLFTNLLRDLICPYDAIKREKKAHPPAARRTEYRLFSFTESGQYDPNNPEKDFVVRAEIHGIPQARHRVVIFGIREDLECSAPTQLEIQETIPVKSALKGFPPLRSGLSKLADSPDSWIRALKTIKTTHWYKNGLAALTGECTVDLMDEILDSLSRPQADRGSEFVPARKHASWNADWFHDKKLGGYCNHASRGHMLEDLHRYFYAACYAAKHNVSPQLRQFPRELLPNHKNVSIALKNGNFSDRFRVQVYTRPATTITSHISKDGHYYIHPDPAQCRSLTVREAARLQTFPDNYFFCGPRTNQYGQVGNAVPPLLALQIAKILYSSLRKSGI